MFGKYKNIVLLDNEKDATIVAGKEKFPGVNYEWKEVYPVAIVLSGRRNYLKAITKSLEYSKLGIFNLIVKD